MTTNFDNFIEASLYVTTNYNNNINNVNCNIAY